MGDGVIKVEMHFLPDIYVPCDQCKGKRYNRETLEIKYKGKTIHEVLDMTIEEAREFFDAVPALARKLQTLMDVGLTYIRLGQSATTLSGGEAQRVKLALTQGTAEGPNVLYFETGQGSELSSEAHFGTDQVTMEARCHGFARHFSPFLVNTVVGFIGPEYLYDARQVMRAGLEDHFMGKLSGIPMGCDACYTNHMKADQNDIEKLAVLLTAAGCNYFMGIPHGDDVMLNYQTTGFRETAALRELFGLTAIAPFQRWLERMGFVEDGKLTARAGDGSALL